MSFASTNFSTGQKYSHDRVFGDFRIGRQRQNSTGLYREVAALAGTLLANFVIALQQIGETRGIVQEGEIELADGAIALLGDNDFGSAP